MKAKKYINYIICAILVICIIVLVYLLIISYSEKEEKEVVISNTGATAIEVVEEEKDYKIEKDLTNQKLIFTNSLYQYKIRLPDDWSIDDIDIPSYVAFYDPEAAEQEIVSELLQGMKMEVYVLDMPAGMTLEEKVNADITDFEEAVIDSKDVLVDNQPAIKVKMDVLGYSVTTYVEKDGNLYEIAAYIGSDSEINKYTALYSSILSDFEFLD